MVSTLLPRVKDAKAVQPSKAWLSIEDTLSGMVREANFVQFWKAENPILVTSLPIVRVVNSLISLKALSLMPVIPSPMMRVVRQLLRDFFAGFVALIVPVPLMVRVVRLVQPENKSDEIPLLLGTVADVRVLQLKAPDPTVSTVAGIVKVVKLQPSKA